MSTLKIIAEALGLPTTEEKDGIILHISKLTIDDDGIGREYEECQSCTILSKLKAGLSSGDILGGDDLGVGVIDLNTGTKVDVSDLSNLPDDMPDEVKELLSALSEFKQNKNKNKNKSDNVVDIKSESEGHTKH